MIDTNKVLEQIYKLILAYTKDKKLDSNKAKYVLKSAIEKVLKFNGLDIETSKTIVSVVERIKVLEKIKTLDFNRLSSNKDYVDPLQKKPINIKQVLSIVYGVIDSQIKSLDAVLLDSQDEEFKREINEIKSSPIARFSPNAYRLLSKKTVLFESEDLEEDELESKSYKHLLEIANIIAEDNVTDKIFSIIRQFKSVESNKESFIVEILDKRIGKIIEAIALKVLQEKGNYNITIEGKESGTKYIDNGMLVFDLMSTKDKEGFNLYSFYKKVLEEDNLDLNSTKLLIDEANKNKNFNILIESDEYLKDVLSVCENKLVSEIDSIQSFLDSFQNKITFKAFTYKLVNSLGEEETKSLLTSQEENMPSQDMLINRIEVLKNCLVPFSKQSPFDFYFDLKITYDNDKSIVVENGLCVDIKHTYQKNFIKSVTATNVSNLKNNLITSVILVADNRLVTNTYFTKTNLSVEKEKVIHRIFDMTKKQPSSIEQDIDSVSLISKKRLVHILDHNYKIHYIDRKVCSENSALLLANKIKDKVLRLFKKTKNTRNIAEMVRSYFEQEPYFLKENFSEENVYAIILVNSETQGGGNIPTIITNTKYIDFNKKNDFSYCLDALNRVKEYVVEIYTKNVNVTEKVIEKFNDGVFIASKFNYITIQNIIDGINDQTILKAIKPYRNVKNVVSKTQFIKKGEDVDVLEAYNLINNIKNSVIEKNKEHMSRREIASYINEIYGKNPIFVSENFKISQINKIVARYKKL